MPHVLGHEELPRDSIPLSAGLLQAGAQQVGRGLGRDGTSMMRPLGKPPPSAMSILKAPLGIVSLRPSHPGLLKPCYNSFSLPGSQRSLKRTLIQLIYETQT